MTNISSLPEEVLLHIFSFLPTSSLTSVWRTARHWRDLSSRPLAARIQSSWANPRYYPSAAEVRCAAALVTPGYLPGKVQTKLANRIKSSWSHYNFYPSVAEVRCAAALAATGHLTKVMNMQLNLRDLKLPNMLSLTRVVRGRVFLSSVTGDIGPLVSSLTCSELWIQNMELDQAATCSGVLARWSWIT